MELSQQSLSEGCPTYGARYKVVHDPVHKTMSLDDGVLQIIDTPEFQRLRELKQLGTAYYVFPGASHNRFEHSLGVSFLSGQMVDFLASQQPHLNITAAEKMYVRIAGAVHDLGHGPFSHVFDSLFIPTARPDRASWSHEDMSLALFDTLIDDNHIDILDDGGRDVIKRMVSACKPAPRGILVDDRAFLYEIVANGVNGIDTDKWDYLARDTYNLGMTSAFDHRRLMYSSRVVHGHIGFHAKEVHTVYTLFHTRYMLFKQIYVHRATKSIEFMLNDILLEADRAWNGRMSRAIDDPREYAALTDCVLRDIETSRDPSLARAQSILKSLRTRKLYRFVDELLVPLDIITQLPKMTSADICAMNPDPSIRMDPALVIVHDVKFNYGKGAENPVDYVRFYRDAADEHGFRIPREKVSHLLPTTFQERVVRIYSRIHDTAFISALQKAFRSYLRTFKRELSMRPDPSSRVYHSQTLDADIATADATSPSYIHDEGVRDDGMALDAAPLPRGRHVVSGLEFSDDEDAAPSQTMHAHARALAPTAPPVAVHGSSGVFSQPVGMFSSPHRRGAPLTASQASAPTRAASLVDAVHVHVAADVSVCVEDEDEAVYASRYALPGTAASSHAGAKRAASEMSSFQPTAVGSRAGSVAAAGNVKKQAVAGDMRSYLLPATKRSHSAPADV